MPPPNYSQTLEAIVRCDVPQANVQISYQQELQSDEIRISDLGPVTEQKLRCLKAAVHPFYILTIDGIAQRAAYYEFSESEDRPQRKAQSKLWLQSKGLQDRLPTFEPKRGVSAFAADLEHACGIKPGSAVMVHGSSFLTTRPDFVASTDFEKVGENLACLMNMFTASNAGQHNINFGFIGNEQVANEKK